MPHLFEDDTEVHGHLDDLMVAHRETLNMNCKTIHTTVSAVFPSSGVQQNMQQIMPTNIGFLIFYSTN